MDQASGRTSTWRPSLYCLGPSMASFSLGAQKKHLCMLLIYLYIVIIYVCIYIYMISYIYIHTQRLSSSSSSSSSSSLLMSVLIIFQIIIVIVTVKLIMTIHCIKNNNQNSHALNSMNRLCSYVNIPSSKFTSTLASSGLDACFTNKIG